MIRLAKTKGVREAALILPEAARHTEIPTQTRTSGQMHSIHEDDQPNKLSRLQLAHNEAKYEAQIYKRELELCKRELAIRDLELGELQSILSRKLSMLRKAEAQNEAATRSTADAQRYIAVLEKHIFDVEQLLKSVKKTEVAPLPVELAKCEELQLKALNEVNNAYVQQLAASQSRHQNAGTCTTLFGLDVEIGVVTKPVPLQTMSWGVDAHPELVHTGIQGDSTEAVYLATHLGLDPRISKVSVESVPVQREVSESHRSLPLQVTAKVAEVCINPQPGRSMALANPTSPQVEVAEDLAIHNNKFSSSEDVSLLVSQEQEDAERMEQIDDCGLIPRVGVAVGVGAEVGAEPGVGRDSVGTEGTTSPQGWMKKQPQHKPNRSMVVPASADVPKGMNAVSWHLQRGLHGGSQKDGWQRLLDMMADPKFRHQNPQALCPYCGHSRAKLKRPVYRVVPFNVDAVEHIFKRRLGLHKGVTAETQTDVGDLSSAAHTDVLPSYNSLQMSRCVTPLPTQSQRTLNRPNKKLGKQPGSMSQKRLPTSGNRTNLTEHFWKDTRKPTALVTISRESPPISSKGSSRSSLSSCRSRKQLGRVIMPGTRLHYLSGVGEEESYANVSATGVAPITTLQL